MSESVKMPALGESVTEGTVSSWLKAVGDTVEADEPLLEVATDKVDTEVPSPASGVLLEIRVPEDETVEVGTVLAIIGDPSEAGSAPAPAAPAPQAAPEPPAPAPAPAAEAPAPAAPAATAASAAAAPVSSGASGSYVTPIVRKLAKDKGVDLSTVTGTGVGGRIRKQDVEAAAKAAEEAAKAAENAAETTAEAVPTVETAAAKTVEAAALPDTIPAGQSAAPANVAAPSLEAPRSE